MLKRKKKTERKKLIDELDELIRQIVRKRDVVCQHCGKTHLEAQLQVAHVVTRGWFGVRWDLLNVLLLCARCHFIWHKNPNYMGAWFYERYPGWAKYLLHTQKCRQWKIWELQELKQQLKHKLSEIDS